MAMVWKEKFLQHKISIKIFSAYTIVLALLMSKTKSISQHHNHLTTLRKYDFKPFIIAFTVSGEGHQKVFLHATP